MNATMLLPLILLGGMMFFMTRSQKKQQKQRQELLNSMDVGSKVVTIGGLHGVVSEINTEKSTVILDCEGIFLEFNRVAIATVTPTEETATVEPAVEVKEDKIVKEVETVEEVDATEAIVEEQK
ncbi:preprotein translocase subunit YajC [Vagococcus intermedius]|uniref:Preprotein translocase subunit YajC n=1 Tax=Vagococcus intermedius TaxID=2991418 RepID=A0AAF0I7M8_9ENTE|nr:preprotein translocase subunit YajC [Vagococcus intermedius]WEG73439.1 preprotein translocase subunit YajC [Vagococcus intermedius]WEG75522.1 preprotein translocase subunit YajC [Vagococcus intermedius]